MSPVHQHRQHPPHLIFHRFRCARQSPGAGECLTPEKNSQLQLQVQHRKIFDESRKNASKANIIAKLSQKIAYVAFSTLPKITIMEYSLPLRVIMTQSSSYTKKSTAESGAVISRSPTTNKKGIGHGQLNLLSCKSKNERRLEDTTLPHRCRQWYRPQGFCRSFP